MEVLMCLLATVFTLIFPIIALPLNIIGMIFTNNRSRKYFGFLAAFSLAMIAFVWIPDTTMDLYRHQQQLRLFTGLNWGQMANLVKSNLEPLQYLVKFFVAQTGSNNLLQFLVILCGYAELFWIVSDYCEMRNVRRSVFGIAMMFVLSGVRFIDFASGLWCNLAIINLALGLHLNYFRKTKWIQYVFYAVAACLHAGTMYVVALALLLNKVRVFRKPRAINLIMLSAAILSFGGIVMLLNNVFGSGVTIVSMLNRMYDSYFVRGGQFDSLHTGWNLVFAVINMALAFILGVWGCRKAKAGNEYCSFVMYMSVGILATTITAGVFIRYSFLLVILMTPLLVDYFMVVRSRRAKAFFLAFVSILIVAQLSRSVAQMHSDE